MPTKFVKKPTPKYIILGLNLNYHSSVYNLPSFMSTRPLLCYWLIFGVTQLQIKQG